jgi:hypothetical protein
MQNANHPTHSRKVHGFHVDLATQLSHMRITSAEALVCPHPLHVLCGIVSLELNTNMRDGTSRA